MRNRSQYDGLALGLFLVFAFGCDTRTKPLGAGDTNNEAPSDSDPDIGSDTDTDSDTDSDLDTNSDSDADSDTDENTESNTISEYIDQDRDGWIKEFDCDDNNPDVNPGKTEQIDPPNGVDEDCDGLTDELPVDPNTHIRSSTIWIANSYENTLSKINTRTMKHRGRYWVRPDEKGSPSRTSVNGNGDVVVASRGPGAVTMFRGNTEKCVESNGTPGIQTSTGVSDTLNWNTEECRGWYRDFSSFNNCRAVAWTSGTYDRNTQLWNDPKVWAACSVSHRHGSGVAYLLNGDDGTTEMTIPLPDIRCDGLGHIAYGAVVDSENNFWITQLGANKLIKVDRKTGDYKTWDQRINSYGISIDEKNRIWLCNQSVGRFDIATETWKTSEIIPPDSGSWSGSCSPDGKGNIWVSRNNTMVALDSETLEILDMIRVPTSRPIWGVAVDVDGFVWGVPKDGNSAFRIDPSTHNFRSVGGLNRAYTYSDMTGFLLGLTAPPVN